MKREDGSPSLPMDPNRLDPALLRRIGESPEGEKLRSALGDEQALSEAVRKGDRAALQGALSRLLATEEGRKLFRELGSMMGKK